MVETLTAVPQARRILSTFKDGRGNTTPEDYDWFGCETDEELADEIDACNQFEGRNLEDEDELRALLEIMYYG